MALSITSNFAGDADVIYTDVAEGNEVIAGNKYHKGSIAYLELDVPDKRELRFGKQTSRPIGAWVKTPTSSDTTVSTTFDKRELNLEKVMTYEHFTPEDYDFEWPDMRSVGSQTEHKLNPKLFRQMLRLLVPNIGSHVSELFFEGDKTATGTDLEWFDGIFTKALADANTLKAANIGPIVKTNVFDVLSNVVDKIPTKDYNNDEYKILVPMSTWKFVNRANTDVKATTEGILDMGFKNQFEGKDIIPYVGLGDNHIIATKVGSGPQSNLHMGFWFNEKREISDARIARLAANSEEWFLRINYKMDANYKYSENMIIYNGI